MEERKRSGGEGEEWKRRVEEWTLELSIILGNPIHISYLIIFNILIIYIRMLKLSILLILSVTIHCRNRLIQDNAAI